MIIKYNELITIIVYGSTYIIFIHIHVYIYTHIFEQSSLLMALLGELPLTRESSVEIYKSTLSLVPQEPWIFSSSIRQNILFGKTFEINKYRRVIEAVCFEKVIIR